MKIFSIIRISLITIIILLSSCIRSSQEHCAISRLCVFEYFPDYNSEYNKLNQFASNAKNVILYAFDKNGKCYKIFNIEVNGKTSFNLSLPKGSYTLIGWANEGNHTAISTNSLNALTINDVLTIYNKNNTGTAPLLFSHQEAAFDSSNNGLFTMRYYPATVTIQVNVKGTASPVKTIELTNQNTGIKVVPTTDTIWNKEGLPPLINYVPIINNSNLNAEERVVAKFEVPYFVVNQLNSVLHIGFEDTQLHIAPINLKNYLEKTGYKFETEYDPMGIKYKKVININILFYQFYAKVSINYWEDIPASPNM